MKNIFLNKKVCSLLFAILLLACSVFTPMFSSATSIPEGIKVWDGTTATAFAGGLGTKKEPYLISNGAELHYLVNITDAADTQGKYFKLTSDIYLNNVFDSNWKTNAKPWSSTGTFRGHLDGDGHVIYGVHCVKTSGWSALLYSTICSDKTATANNPVSIKNLGIENSYFEGKFAGAFLGKPDADNGYAHFTMENCYAGADVEVIATSVGRCGGLIASIEKKNVTINNCYFTGIISAGKYRGGLVGFVTATEDDAKTVKISNSYIVTDVPVVSDSTNAGSKFVKYENVYSTKGLSNVTGITPLTKEEMTGEAAKTNMPGLAWDSIWYTTKNGYPTLTAPEVPACDHTNKETTDNVTKAATYFTTGLKDVVCECGVTAQTGVVIPATDVALTSSEEKYADGNLTITLTYSEDLLEDIDNGAKLYFNYSIGGYNPKPIEIPYGTAAEITLEGFNVDRLNAELTYYLTAEYGEVDTTKLVNATKDTLTVAEDIELDDKTSTFISALNTETNTVVSAEIGATDYFAENTITADIKAGTMVLNFVASDDLVKKLGENSGLARTNKITVTIDGVENEYKFTPGVMRKSTTIKISGMSFAQLYGKVTIKVEFEYEADATKNVSDTITFEGAKAVEATDTPVATAFKNYIA